MRKLQLAEEILKAETGDARSLGRHERFLVGLLAVSWALFQLGLAGFLPLPVKFHISFGEPMRFQGDPTEDDAHMEDRVDLVKDAIRDLVADGRARRQGFFG